MTAILKFHRRGAKRRLALACAGVLSVNVLAPSAILAQYAPGSFAVGPGGVVAPTNGSAFLSPPAGENQGYAYNPSGSPRCLPARALSGVVASDDRKVILRFGSNVFYRLRLTRACPALIAPGAHVVGVTRGNGADICGADDVELRVAADDGSVSRCNVDRMSRMSQAEIQAAGGQAIDR
jgi:hypothetical protein